MFSILKEKLYSLKFTVTINMSALYNIMTVINQTHVTVFSFALACLFTGIYALIKLARVGQRPKGLPPGPRTLPILGNLHAMPTFKPYKVFAEWGKIYGPVYSLMVGSNPLVMIQSQQAAKELLDKRGSNYSSRPDLYIFSELSSRGLRQVAMVSLASATVSLMSIPI